MQTPKNEIHVSATEASAGSKPNAVRYVLLIGLLLTIIALSAIWIVGASSAPQDTPGDRITNQAVPAPAAPAGSDKDRSDATE